MTTNLNYLIIVVAVLVCQTLARQCIYDDGNFAIDLTDLSHVNGIVTVAPSYKYHIIVNVCKPLGAKIDEHEYGKCNSESYGCLVMKTNTTITYNLGRYQSLRFGDTNFVSDFDTGDICHNNPNYNYSASIKFRCGMSFARPFYWYENEDTCHYEFIWYTPYACLI
jgi:hypothetical protein